MSRFSGSFPGAADRPCALDTEVPRRKCLRGTCVLLGDAEDWDSVPTFLSKVPDCLAQLVCRDVVLRIFDHVDVHEFIGVIEE